MRSMFAVVLLLAAGATSAVADMTQEEKSYHALHGLLHMYAVGSICYYDKWSFSKQELDEMLQKIGELSKSAPPRNVDVMWSEARAMMAEGQEKTTATSCVLVHQEYVKGRAFIFGTRRPEAGKAPL